MKSFKLTPDGDIDLTNGRTSFVDGAAYVEQKIRTRLLFLRGEWALDTRLGMPWFEEILGRRVLPERLDSLVRQAINTILEVATVNQVAVDVDELNRSYTISYQVTTTGGEIVSGGVPFIVE